MEKEEKTKCHYCRGEIKEGEKVHTYLDGVVIHEDCYQEILHHNDPPDVEY
jgi:hypothetical protein